MSEYDVGANRHEWETRYAEIDEDAAGEPVEILAELTDLVEEMAKAAGYRTALPEGETGEAEVVADLARARELVAADEAGEEVRHDDAQQAAAGLRDLYRALIEHPEADSRANLDLGNP
jgi:hypothetical protein